ncbi:lantibiotic dehydratase [Streptomyces diastaticus]|uniref:lantibiotic dehydratase n=1 Tax=Streptomyces diastaticus TaxID=1956 RepID=UPI0036542827
MSRPLRYTVERPALLRAVTVVGPPAPPDLTDGSPAGALRSEQWLRSVWDERQLREAITHSSPVVARSVDAVLAGEAAMTGDLLITVAAYCRRGSGRPTPFGHWAGITATSFGGGRVFWGDGHRVTVQAQGEWLAAVVDELEAVPEVRERLTLVAASHAVLRGERLVVPWQQRGRSVAGTEVREVSLRAEPEVRFILSAARSPIQYRDLLSKLGAEFCVAPDAARGLVDGMIERRVLVTCLQPPVTTPDAVGHVVGQLDALGAVDGPVQGRLVELRGVHDAIRQHNGAATAPGAVGRDRVEARMRDVAETSRSPLAVDTLLDADVEIPRVVAWEVEAAAEVLARVSAEPYGASAWRRYRDAFLERWGPGEAVPLLDLTDPVRGLGMPEGYHSSPVPPHRLVDPYRDTVLLGLAEHAVMAGEEVVLDEDLIARLSVGDPDQMVLPPHLEIGGEIHSGSLREVQAGAFTVQLQRVSRGWGHLTGGRFATLLSQGKASEEDQALLGLLARRPTSVDAALVAQVSAPALTRTGVHITRVPQLAPVISLAEHRSPGGDVLDLSDLAVLCDGSLLHLVSLSRRKVVEPGTFNPLQIECQTPWLVRFLDEMVRGQRVQFQGPYGDLCPWNWGASAYRLPALPRVRFGRSVLSPRMWLVHAEDLPPRGAGAAQWADGLERLRERRGIPDRVLMERFDQKLRLDLSQPTDAAILRKHLGQQAPAGLNLVEAPAQDAFGWADRPAEFVALLRSRQAPAAQPDIPLRPSRGRATVHVPGASRYLRVLLYGMPQQRRHLLADHLPELLDTLGHPLWWAEPQDGADPHLALTVRLPDPGAGAAAMQRVGLWADTLIATAALREIAYVPYRPAAGLWGHGDVQQAADAVRAADTRVVVEQLAAPAPAGTPGPGPEILAAASLAALSGSFLGGSDHGRAWLTCQPKEPGPRLRPDALRLLKQVLDEHAAHPSPAWTARADALATYGLLRRSASAHPDRVLEALARAHLLLALGPDPAAHRAARRLARAHALAASRP